MTLQNALPRALYELDDIESGLRAGNLRVDTLAGFRSLIGELAETAALDDLLPFVPIVRAWLIASSQLPGAAEKVSAIEAREDARDRADAIASISVMNETLAILDECLAGAADGQAIPARALRNILRTLVTGAPLPALVRIGDFVRREYVTSMNLAREDSLPL